MALPTLTIGFLPTYSQIGLWAPFILVLCRLLQGLCAGGEYNGASIFIIEHLGTSRRGLAGSLISASGAIGSLIAMILGATLLHSHLPSWSWRIPFLLGAFLAFIGFYIRRRLQESPEFLELLAKKPIQRSPVNIPLLMALRNYPLSIFRAFAVGAFANVLANTLVVYLNVYLTKVVGISIAHSMFFNSIGLLVVIFMIPFIGWLSDKVGQVILMRIGAVLVISTIYPIFLLLNSGTNEKIISVQISLAILMSLFLGPSNAFMNRLFPASIRYSGIAFGYCSGMALMGGTMPAISTYLIAITNDIMAPAYYLIICGFIGFLAVYKIKDTSFVKT
jgi:MHS family proline/betaine transporter-like MFS transporter